MTELRQTEEGVAELKADVAFSPSPVRASGVYARVGRADKALAIVDEELARVERSGTRRQESGLYRTKGEAILMRRDSSAAGGAEKYFRKAIEIARVQSAKWWELQATTSLARLLRGTGRHDEGRTMLSDIYNWFTEGFDTAALKDAKAPLVKLNA